jgi:hypothetical protein
MAETDPDSETDDPPLPETVQDRAETLTRRAREAVDENEREAYLEHRDALLADYDYDARVREGDTGETLVLYPAEWLDDGTVQIERVENTDRAVEVALSGPGSGADWAAIDEHNREIADRVRAEHGDVHGDTAEAFAAFMSNHYAKPIERATAAERTEFREEYVRRNAWPTDEQLAALEESLRLVLETAESG